MSHIPSLLLYIQPDSNSLLSVIEWLNTQAKLSLTTETIVNQANIILINQEKEHIGIETIRTLKQQLAFAAYQTGKVRYCIFLDAHLMGVPTQNALLKTVEEPPENTQLIFVTSTPEKLLETIRSRCNQVRLTTNQAAARNTSQSTTDHSDIQALYEQLIHANVGQKISLASAYKERSDALQLCTALLTFLHQELKNPQEKYTIQQLVHNSQRLLVAIEQIEQNVNPLLALENCLFELLSN